MSIADQLRDAVALADRIGGRADAVLINPELVDLAIELGLEVVFVPHPMTAHQVPRSSMGGDT